MDSPRNALPENSRLMNLLRILRIVGCCSLTRLLLPISQLAFFVAGKPQKVCQDENILSTALANVPHIINAGYLNFMGNLEKRGGEKLKRGTSKGVVVSKEVT